MLYALNVIADFQTADSKSMPSNGFFSAVLGERVWNMAGPNGWVWANPAYPNDAAHSDARNFSPSIQASYANAASADSLMFILRVRNTDGTPWAGLSASTTRFWALFSRRRRHANFVRRTASPFGAAANRPKTVIGPDLQISPGPLPSDPLVMTSQVPAIPPLSLVGNRGIAFEFTLVIQFVGPDGNTYQLSFDPELDVDVNN